jgi:hypothetical protein
MAAERWTFGVDPLPQTLEAAALMRHLTGLILSLEGEQPGVDRLILQLQAAEETLRPLIPPDQAPRLGAAAHGDGRVYLDHARHIGAYNACFPVYDIAVDGDRAHGSVTFPLPYEGPPGIVHGGFLAVFFDCVVQHHNCDVGVTGRTTSLSVRYRRPTPLLAPLTFTVDRTVAGGRIRSLGRLLSDERLLCEAEVDAVAADRAALPEVSPRHGP